MRSKLVSLCAAFALSFVCAARASAHDGPPYAILVDKSLGPAVASVWADPDVGTGTFFVILEPAPGAALPEDIEIDIAVRPSDGHAAEAVHAAAREAVRGRVQYTAGIPFDAEGRWHVRVLLRSTGGGGGVETDVEVTPPGLGRWDLLIYLFPFLLIGALWLRAVTRRGRRGSGRAAGV